MQSSPIPIGTTNPSDRRCTAVRCYHGRTDPDARCRPGVNALIRVVIRSPNSADIHRAGASIDKTLSLSATQFAQVLEALGAGHDTRPNERRLHPRIGIRGHLTIIPVKGGQRGASMQVRIRDVSKSGIGILHTNALRIDSQFVAKLPQTKGSDEFILICRVANCRHVGNDLFEIGATYQTQVRSHAQPVHSPENA